MFPSWIELTRVLVALKHELSLASSRVPELHTTVLATGHDPLAIGSEGNAEDKVLVSLEGLDALAALGLDASTVVEASVVELPHLDGLVKRTRDEMATIRGERDTVDTVLVALFSFSTLNKNTSLGVPNADALVQATCSDEAVVGGDGDSGDAVFDLESEDALVLLDVPKSDCAVAGTRGDVTSVRSEVERVDVLFVTRELVEDALGGNVPNLFHY
jgi:hypothetical protein